MRVHGGKFKQKPGVAVVACMSTVLLAAIWAPSALARPADPFKPTFTMITEALEFPPPIPTAVPNLQAGAATDLIIEVKSKKNQCAAIPNGEQYPQSCAASDLYVEQEMKKMQFHFPPGLLGDPNAAPYCDPYRDWGTTMSTPSDQNEFVWFCRKPESFVGFALIGLTLCGRDASNQNQGVCRVAQGLDGLTAFYPGSVFLDQPREGEQGHLVVLLPGAPPPYHHELGGYLKIDVSIRADASDGSMIAVADNMPSPTRIRRRYRPEYGGADAPDYALPNQVAGLTMALYGSVGEESGHPLLTNPTFCDPQSIDAEFQGYLHNSTDSLLQLSPGETLMPDDGRGDGTNWRPQSVPYQVQGCDAIPYDPKLSLDLSDKGADRATAVTSTINQAQGEATTKTVKVTFPDAFKINAQNRATFCSDADLAAKTCPDSSKVGEAKAYSHLLPPDKSPLTGEVYLTGLKGDAIGISMLLHGFVDLRIDGSGMLTPDGRLQTTFDNLPAVPLERFDLSLYGGEKGLLKTPRVCGPQTIASQFTSHSGKIVDGDQTIDITGCKDPTIDVELTPRKTRSLTDLDLRVNSNGIRLREVELQLARHLKWGLRGKAAKSGKRKAPSAGSISITTPSGTSKRSLKARRTKRGNVGFTPLTQQGLGALGDISATLFRTRRRQPRLNQRGIDQETRKKRRRQSDIVIVSGFPKQAMTGAELALRGTRGSFFLKTPTGCKRPFNFVARMIAQDGTRYVAHDALRLRGKGCPRR